MLLQREVEEDEGDAEESEANESEEKGDSDEEGEKESEKGSPPRKAGGAGKSTDTPAKEGETILHVNNHGKTDYKIYIYLLTFSLIIGRECSSQ